MLKEQKGITLIALVITVIVLLILAGVALSMLTADDGSSIFTRAHEAGTAYNTAAQDEKDEIDALKEYIDNLTATSGTTTNN